jgi:hypothetical protein
MSKIAHRIFIGTLVLIVFLTLIFILYLGFNYYKLPLEERFYYNTHNYLKPSGLLGHGFGIIGSLCMIIGVSIYMSRKRFKFLLRIGLLKHWLEFHIFLCTLGPILVLYHTAFKFGGLVAISFWSMVAVFLSGIIGRFIYIQIPRSVEGRELNFTEIRDLKSDVDGLVRNTVALDEESYKIIAESVKRKVELIDGNPIISYFKRNADDRKSVKNVKKVLKEKKLPGNEVKKILFLVKEDLAINRKMDRLETMSNLFKYWHVIHSPFALLMLIIMVIHVVITIALGYRWIF